MWYETRPSGLSLLNGQRFHLLHGLQKLCLLRRAKQRKRLGVLLLQDG